MQMQLIETSNKQPVDSLKVVKNFRKVIESRDINKMNKELYQFLNLHCGFIAHYDINGFKSVYSAPKDFAEVFIRHFDNEHRYFNGIYHCHEEQYEDTGFTKGDIKEEFNRIVDQHKCAIGRWAENRQRNERHKLYMMLRNEFETEDKKIKVRCDASENNYDVQVQKEGQGYTDFDIICCMFCGHQIKLY